MGEGRAAGADKNALKQRGYEGGLIGDHVSEGGEVECDVVEAGAAGGGVIEREGEDALKMAHPAMVLASQVKMAMHHNMLMNKTSTGPVTP